MSTRLIFEGMDAFRRQLRQLPAELRDEAQELVNGAATRTAARVESAYPVKTGTLKRRVTMSKDPPGPFSAGAVVRSGAPHAAIYEFGTALRQTRSGANRGRMPTADPSRRLIPIARQERARLWEALRALVRKAGFQVDR